MNTKENNTTEEQNVGEECLSSGNCQNCGNAEGESKEDYDKVEEQNADGECAEKTDAERIADLEKENTDLHDQFLRKSADFENYRKRMMREKQDAFDYANTNLLTDLIAILDDFDRALAAGIDDGENPVADLKPVVDGIKIINKQMRGLLEAKYNLNAYGEKGDIFDHDKHEAIATNPGAVAEAVCSEVYLRGYMLKERVIRPAKVMVIMPDGSVSAGDESSSGSDKNDGSVC